MFVPALNQVPEEYEVEGGHPDYWVLTLLAVSDDELRDVAVRTMLIPFTYENTSAHELQFEIVIAGDEADEVFVTQDRFMARGYLPAEVGHALRLRSGRSAGRNGSAQRHLPCHKSNTAT